MKARVLAVLLALVFIAGCRHKQPLPKIPAVRFQGCAVITRVDGSVTCDCNNIVWAFDANTKALVALCGNLNRRKTK